MSCSSQSKEHPVKAILNSSASSYWQTANPEKKAFIELELDKPTKIETITIGNYNCNNYTKQQSMWITNSSLLWTWKAMLVPPSSRYWSHRRTASLSLTRHLTQACLHLFFHLWAPPPTLAPVRGILNVFFGLQVLQPIKALCTVSESKSGSNRFFKLVVQFLGSIFTHFLSNIPTQDIAFTHWTRNLTQRNQSRSGTRSK